MAPQLPGFTISVLRQRTFGRPNEPILISGRVSLLGIGFPAFVRVFVEGPELNPEIRTFDTSAVTGDYVVNVLAERDGRYQVYSQAFIAPRGLGPPVAESPSKPPILIGEPANGDVIVDGQRRSAPPQTPVEVSVSVPVTFAPFFFLGGAAAPRAPAPVAAAPLFQAPGEVMITGAPGGVITGFRVE